MADTIVLGLIQYDATLGQVDSNIARVDELIAGHHAPFYPDILILPEMAFTGYVFSSREEIEPFLESPNLRCPSITWAKSTAQKLSCFVCVGFPELADDGSAYNSMAVVDRTGTLAHVYRKHFLYDTDKFWATEGPGFAAFKLTTRAGRTMTVCPAICMDLNPKDFVAPFEAFEFANHAKLQQCDLVLCSMNWLRSEAVNPVDQSESDWEQVSPLLNYWATRMTPLLGAGAIFACCNRIGTEKSVVFAGSSCVMQLSATPTVIDYASQSAERLLVVRTHLA